MSCRRRLEFVSGSLLGAAGSSDPEEVAKVGVEPLFPSALGRMWRVALASELRVVNLCHAHSKQAPIARIGIFEGPIEVWQPDNWRCIAKI
jgi:hypothetical protein